MVWKEVKIKIPDHIEDNIVEIFNHFDAGGVVISKTESPIQDNEYNWEYLIVYYPADDKFAVIYNYIEKKLASFLAENIPKKISKEINIDLGQIDDKDWSISWHEFFSPTPVGNNFMVCPSWLEPPETDRKIIEIDPGQAFGVGTHETTFLTVLLLEKYLQDSKKGDQLLDIGTGTGILAIVAAKMGIDYILGIDISEDAVRTAKDNIKINNLSHEIALQTKDLLSGVYGSYSYVTANLLPDLIDRLLPEIVKYTSKGGMIILSGIIDSELDRILIRIGEFNLSVIDTVQKGEWVSIVIEKG